MYIFNRPPFPIALTDKKSNLISSNERRPEPDVLVLNKYVYGCKEKF